MSGIREKDVAEVLPSVDMTDLFPHLGHAHSMAQTKEKEYQHPIWNTS
jgi:hypothetical protein